MRALACVFSFYLLLLGFMPCNDSDDCLAGSATTASTGKHTDDKNAATHCTDFCTCTCCAAVTLSQPVTLPQLYFSFTTVSILQQPTPAIQNNSAAIWQPPRQQEV